jgi:hypothetical protein
MSKIRILICGIIVCVISSYAPRGSALPCCSLEIDFYNGVNCPDEQVGSFSRDCHGAKVLDGQQDGTWKWETTVNCQSGTEETQLYQKCGGSWFDVGQTCQWQAC